MLAGKWKKAYCKVMLTVSVGCKQLEGLIKIFIGSNLSNNKWNSGSEWCIIEWMDNWLISTLGYRKYVIWPYIECSLRLFLACKGCHITVKYADFAWFQQPVQGMQSTSMCQ